VSAWSQAAGRAKKTDWWSVAGELVIVILGILIAFQLDRWSEGWRGAKDRSAYLQRLAEETDANVVALTRLKKEFDAVTAEVGRMAGAVGDPARRAAFRFDGDRACRSLQLPASKLQTAALEEIGNPAALQLVPDPTLRRLIHVAAAETRFADRQIEYFRDTFQRFGERIDPHSNWRVDPASGETGCSVDFEALAREPGALTLLTRIYRDRRVFGDIHDAQIDAQRAVGRRAACLRDGSC
jgi:hypothetical protein